MVIAIIAGQQEDKRFPGRNTFSLLGRPMMAYPILAALHAEEIDQVFLTTDSDLMNRVARSLGASVLARSPEMSGPSVRLLDVVLEAAERAQEIIGQEPEAVVLLLCNAPTVSSGLIDHGVRLLRENPSLDAVESVSLHDEFHPVRALRIGEAGLLIPNVVLPEIEKKEGAYFPDALLSVVRPHLLHARGRAVLSDWVVDCSLHRVSPLVHEGYGDVDFIWQVPAVEEWLKRQGFSQDSLPYGSVRARQAKTAVLHAPRSTGKRVLITTVPFGEVDKQPLRLLEREGIDHVLNPIGRRLRSEELANLIEDVDVLIAGTEPITAKVMERGRRLRLISRVGIGLDSVDLLAARQRGILVSYTPDAPAPAVAEMTAGLILSLLRSLPRADRGLRGGVWHRFLGRRLAQLTVGVIGAGRVGKRLIRHLHGFGPRILVNDLLPDPGFGAAFNVQWVDKETIYKEADVITLHLPLTRSTERLITRHELSLMKPDAVLVNTSRGGMIDEHDLAQALKEGRLGGAALDVFAQEPYAGELVSVENCILTCHMGSMSRDCRAQMELEATQEAIRFLKGEPLQLLVPEEEYAMRLSQSPG